MYDNVIYKNHNFAKILERKENFVKYRIQIITETVHLCIGTFLHCKLLNFKYQKSSTSLARFKFQILLSRVQKYRNTLGALMESKYI